MSQSRKVKAEIESTFKKIKEGIDEFESIWDRVYDSETQAQKEKYEGDLKRQIKKLQRLRDMLKQWLQSSDSTIAQYYSQIDETKKLIEQKMKEFKECEKETKTKAFSKEGLKQKSRQNPQNEKLDSMIERVKKQICEIQKLIEDCEVEERKEKQKKRNVNTSLVEKLELFIKNHKWHISSLEIVLRQLDNKLIDPYDIEAILDDVDYYIDNYRNKDYVFDNSVYETLDLSVAMESDESDDESESSINEVSIGSPKSSITQKVSSPSTHPVPKSVLSPKMSTVQSPNVALKSAPSPKVITQSATSTPKSAPSPKVITTQPATSTPKLAPSPKVITQPASLTPKLAPSPKITTTQPASLTPKLAPSPKVITQSASLTPKSITTQPPATSPTVQRTTPFSSNPVVSPTKSHFMQPVSFIEPVINYAQVIQRAKSNQESQKIAEEKKNPVITEPSFVPPVTPIIESPYNRLELLNYLSDSYVDFTEHSQFVSTPLYFPTNPVTTPPSFPQVPKSELLEMDVIRNMDAETLLFAYCYCLSDAQRVLIAKALVEKGWLFNSELRTWVTENNGQKSYDYSQWSIRRGVGIPFQAEKPPVS